MDESNKKSVETFAAKKEMLLDHIRYLFPYQDITPGVRPDIQEQDIVQEMNTAGPDRKVLKAGDLVFVQTAVNPVRFAELARISRIHNTTFTVEILECDLKHALFQMAHYGDGTATHNVRVTETRDITRQQILKRAILTFGCINSNAVLNIARV